jgi:hypothetical protein
VSSESVCRLCSTQSKLRRSHILPEFLYKNLYDPKHRLIAIKAEGISDRRFERLQKGLREPLLCEACENRFSGLETYVSALLGKLQNTSSHPPGTVIRLHGVDYTQFKLFQLSLLWRMGVSCQPTFQEVSLGPHEPTLRQMLLDRNPGEPWRFGTVLIRPQGAPENFLKPPIRTRCDGHNAYSAVLAGMIWIFIVSAHSSGLPGQGSLLSPEGVLTIHVGTESAQDFLAALGRELRKVGVVL